MENGHEITIIRQSIDVASVAANTTAEQLFTVNGVTTSHVVLAVNKPTLTAGLGIAGFRVSAANQIGITFVNATAGALDPAAELYTIAIARAN